MEKINGIIIDGKVYEAIKTDEQSCLKCDLIEEDGGCPCRDYCFYLGRYNIFRYSPELTDKLKRDGNKLRFPLLRLWGRG